MNEEVVRGTSTMISMSFLWLGLPDYAARCIRAVIERKRFSISVVATRPSVPICGMERSLGQSVHWIDPQDPEISWGSISLDTPDILFCGGYSFPAFNSLAQQVRDAGGSVILMCDNNWQPGLMNRVVYPIRHRLIHRGMFRGIFVPGASGKQLAASWGYSTSETWTKLYGADPLLFSGGPPLAEREKSLLFVGQFVPRKNLLRLIEAFSQFCDEHQEWVLILCGSGPLAHDIPKHPRIEVRGFLQPTHLANLLRSVRCLVLPSLEEHWGLVVHEAALSGCALALSRTIGAAEDLAKAENSVLFSPHEIDSIRKSLVEIDSWNDARWEIAENTSRKLAKRFGPSHFADSVDAIAQQAVEDER